MNTSFSGVGNLGSDPELKTDPDGKKDPVCNLSINMDSGYVNDAGEYVDTGSFWQEVEIWGKKAEQVARVLKSGYQVKIEGSMRERRWTDEESGDKRSRKRVRADSIYLTLNQVEKLQATS